MHRARPGKVKPAQVRPAGLTIASRTGSLGVPRVVSGPSRCAAGLVATRRAEHCSELTRSGIDKAVRFGIARQGDDMRLSPVSATIATRKEVGKEMGSSRFN